MGAVLNVIPQNAFLRLSRTPLFSYAGGWQETVRDDMSDRGRSPSLEASSTGGWNPETISCAQGLLATDADAAAALEVSARAVQDYHWRLSTLSPA